MKTKLLLLCLAGLLLAGCGAQWPFKWKPTEAQRQAAGLTVDGTYALEEHVPEPAKPILRQTRKAAKITQRYVGLPSQPLAVGSPAAEPVLEQAASDAAKPPPTPTEVAAATVNEIQQAAATGLGIAELLLGAGVTILGTWGAGKAARRVAGWRDATVAAKSQVTETTAALREVVKAIDKLPGDVKDKVKAGQRGSQSSRTEVLVAVARKDQ